MVFDSVREELKDKITPLSKPVSATAAPPMPPSAGAAEKLALKNQIDPEPDSAGQLPAPAKEKNPAKKPLNKRGNKIVSENLNSASTPPVTEPDKAAPAPPKIVFGDVPEELPKARKLKVVEFRTETAEIPEWRLKVQNAARQRLNRGQDETDETISQSQTEATDGATTLKTDELEDFAANGETDADNPTLSRALRRIKKSRNRFYKEPPTPRKKHLDKPHNLYIAAKANQILPKPVKARINAPLKPKTAATSDKTAPPSTKKLPPLPKTAKISTSFDKRPGGTKPDGRTAPPAAATPPAPTGRTEPARPILENGSNHEPDNVPARRPGEVSIKEILERQDLIVEESDIEYARLIPPAQKADPDPPATGETEPAAESPDAVEEQEIEDIAPFALRFNAGLFDLLIGSFLSLFLLAPFMLLGGNWFTLSGLLAFLATCSIVMFIYLTTAVGLFGRTFGMRLFALEVIDIEGESYPTMHQAAVSSSVYLLSLGLGGIGFVTLFFNPEKRAVHDLVSGTIVIREF